MMITKTERLTNNRTIHQFWGSASNTYIIECPDQEVTYLVDCGMPTDVASLSKILKGMPPLKGIFCTHYHVDHVSGWINLKTGFKDCEIWFYDVAEPFIDGRKRIPFPGLDDYFKVLKPCMQEYGYCPHLKELLGGALYGTPFKNGFPGDRVQYFLSHQNILPGFITIPTPGHRPDSVSFFDANSGILITGDFLLVINGALKNNTFVDSKTDQENSIAEIKRTNGIRFIYPGHGICVPFRSEGL